MMILHHVDASSTTQERKHNDSSPESKHNYSTKRKVDGTSLVHVVFKTTLPENWQGYVLTCKQMFHHMNCFLYRGLLRLSNDQKSYINITAVGEHYINSLVIVALKCHSDTNTHFAFGTFVYLSVFCCHMYLLELKSLLFTSYIPVALFNFLYCTSYPMWAGTVKLHGGVFISFYQLPSVRCLIF